MVVLSIARCSASGTATDSTAYSECPVSLPCQVSGHRRLQYGHVLSPHACRLKLPENASDSFGVARIESTCGVDVLE